MTISEATTMKCMPFITRFGLLSTPKEKSSENIVGKGEHAGNQNVLLFPQCFVSFPEKISNFQSHLFCCLQML